MMGCLIIGGLVAMALLTGMSWSTILLIIVCMFVGSVIFGGD